MATTRNHGDRWQVQGRRRGQSPLSKTFVQQSDAKAWGRTMEAAADRAS